MTTRRDFVRLAAVAGLAGIGQGKSQAGERPVSASAGQNLSGAIDRSEWVRLAQRVAEPVLGALARRQLKVEMPVEARHPRVRADYSHLEAVGRLLTGLAPWLESTAAETTEQAARRKLAAAALSGLDAATDPRSADFLNFCRGQQPLVDAAFLAQAFLRSPRTLWGGLGPRTRVNVIAALRSTRVIRPPENNWLLFASMIEAALHRFGEKRDDARLVDGLEKHRRWYVGDGLYGDGAEFHCDYYNAFVIQPMLLEILEVVGDESEAWRAFRTEVRRRLTRFAAIEERLIAPDGSYPVLGRSIAYRCGAFHGLALAALSQRLPPEVPPGQARAALSSVLRRTLGAPGTFDDRGWLRIGLAGAQPSLGEDYISTGSLYLCSVGLLPLGLPARDPFWTEPPQATTWQKAWAGIDLPADHALRGPPER